MKAASTSARSIGRPAYMITMSSATSATTPRSWVMRITAVSKSRCMLGEQLEDLGLDGDVEGGRRLVGDDQCGSSASAIAIMTRWRMPPENWWG